MIYAAFPDSNKEVEICEKCWEKHCDETKFDLREYFSKKWKNLNYN